MLRVPSRLLNAAARLSMPTAGRSTAPAALLCRSSSTAAVAEAEADSGSANLRVAVLLAGCGYLDGSETTEAVSSLIHIHSYGYASWWDPSVPACIGVRWPP